MLIQNVCYYVGVDSKGAKFIDNKHSLTNILSLQMTESDDVIKEDQRRKLFHNIQNISLCDI